MNILAVDGTGEALTLALRAGAKTFKVVRRGANKHDEALLPAAEALLKKARLKWTDLDAVAAASGPGRFTGIRIGLSFAGAAGFQLEIPALGVSRLEALASRSPEPRVLAALPGWKGETYHQEFARKKGRLAAAGAAVWTAPDAWPALRAAAVKKGLAVVEGDADAADLLAPAEAALAAKKLAPLQPFYLKPAGYERPRA